MAGTSRPLHTVSSVTEEGDAPGPCPLCRGFAADLRQQVPYEVIWAHLEKDWNARFDSELRQRYTPRSTADLYRCRICGLDFFHPKNAGGKDFYEAFDRSGYYEDERWEFGVVAASHLDAQAVLDLGSGPGRFLEQLRSSTTRRAGWDLNEASISRLRAAGFEGYTGSLEEVAEKEEHAFDLVTAFHVIEHLEDVDGFLTPALRLVRPGGRLIVSVPNRERLTLADFEVLDFPPHHVSHWSMAQLERLAERFGLRKLAGHFEPLRLHTSVRIVARNAFRKRSGEDRTLGGLLQRSRYGLAVMVELEAPQ